MKKYIPKSIFIIILLFLFSANLTVYAHKGGTDSAGGHYNSSTGEYHYHHGYPAHQHPNGICPYASETTATTSAQKTTKAQSTTKKTETTKVEVTTENTEDNNIVGNLLNYIGRFIVICIIILFLFFIIREIINQINCSKKIKQQEIDNQKTVAISKQKAKDFIRNNNDNIENLRNQLWQLQSEKNLLVRKYNNKISAQRILQTTPGVPVDTYFDSEKRIMTTDKDYPMIVYTSYSGLCFHVKKGHGNSYREMYLFDAADYYYPCGVCAKMITQERYQWYDDVYETIHLIEGLGIKINYSITRNELPIYADIKRKQKADSYIYDEPLSRENILESCEKIRKLDETLMLLISRVKKLEFKSEDSALLIAKKLIRFYSSLYTPYVLAKELQEKVIKPLDDSDFSYEDMMLEITKIGEKVIDNTKDYAGDEYAYKPLAVEFSFQLFAFYIQEFPDEILFYAKSEDTVKYLCEKYIKLFDATDFIEEINNIC